MSENVDRLHISEEAKGWTQIWDNWQGLDLDITEDSEDTVAVHILFTQLCFGRLSLQLQSSLY
jgi:hypothetical protein